MRLKKAVTGKEDQIKATGEAKAETQDGPSGKLLGCCENKFILATFKKIGQRISNSQMQAEQPESLLLEQA